MGLGNIWSCRAVESGISLWLRVGIEERMDGDEIGAGTGDGFVFGDRLMVMSLGCGGCG